MYDAAKLEALGGFDEVYQPAYVEDLDLGVRAWLRGWPSVYCAGARVLHEHRATTSRYFSAEDLDRALEINYIQFLARAIGDPETFSRLWQHNVLRLKALEKEAALSAAAHQPATPVPAGDIRFLDLVNGEVGGLPGTSRFRQASDSGRQPVRSVSAVAWRCSADLQSDAPRRGRLRPSAGGVHRRIASCAARAARDLHRDRDGSTCWKPRASVARAARYRRGVRHSVVSCRAAADDRKVAARDRAARVHADGDVCRRTVRRPGRSWWSTTLLTICTPRCWLGDPTIGKSRRQYRALGRISKPRRGVRWIAWSPCRRIDRSMVGRSRRDSQRRRSGALPAVIANRRSLEGCCS